MKRRICLSLLLMMLLPGCAGIVRKAGDRMAKNLGDAVLDADDPATVRDGLPAYLLLLDGMLKGSPDSPGLLLAAAELNGAYSGNFVGDDSERGKRLARKSLEFAKRAICLSDKPLCQAMPGDVSSFQQRVSGRGERDVARMYGLAAAWAGYIQAYRDDWAAIADLPKVEALLERVVALEPEHARGLPWVYLGVLNTLRPPAAGGQPEHARAAFEKAIALSNDANLYAKVMMAEHYARLLFERELHDRLVDEVLAADPHAPGYTLMNVLAQQRAQVLRASADEYF